MPIYPPGNAGGKNGFPAYREFAQKTQIIEGQSTEFFPATEERGQRQIHLFNPGPGKVFVAYGEPATLNAALIIPPGITWTDSHDGGMAVNVIADQSVPLKGFIRSEGPVVLPSPDEPSPNIEAIADVAWVIPTEIQPSYQVFRTLEENPTINILDTNSILRDNSWAGGELRVSADTQNDPTGISYGHFVNPWPVEDDGWTMKPEAVFTWQVNSTNYGRLEYFWLNANLGLGDYNFIYFSMKIIGRGLMEIVDFRLYN
jgi:hypothetical protein